MSVSKPAWRVVLQPAVIVGALGYFVDIYGLILFSILRIPSLKALGYGGQQLVDYGILLLNCQMVGGVVWGVLGDRIPITLGFDFAKGQLGIIPGAAIVGVICLGVALFALAGLEETHGKDFDYHEVT